MKRSTSAALTILVAFGLMLSLTSAASANPVAGGGYSSSYAGESVFTQEAAGSSGQMSAIFFNDGSQAWSPGVVGLLVCASDKVTCNVPANQTFAQNWFSSTVYATVTTTVGAGQNGFFVYNFQVPAGTPSGTVTTFYGDVGLIATGAELRPQGYFQINTTPTPVLSLTLAPTSASVPVGGQQQFTLSGAPSGSTVAWNVNGGCGAVTNNGLFAATAMNSASQPCSVTASVGGATATAAVTVYGPAASLGCSATPTTIVANGGTTGGVATAYVTLKDSNGNAVANGTNPITLTNVTPGLATVTPTGTVGATNGVATATVASTLTAGTIQISASSASLTGCNVQIVSGAPGSSAATKSSFTSNPIASDGVSTTTLRVDVTDANGNRNTADNSTVVTVSKDTGANVCNIIGVITGSGGSYGTSSGTATAVQGRVEFNVQATTTPGTCTFSATTNNASVAGSSASLQTQITGVANKLTVSSNDSPHPAAATGTCTVAGTGDTNASCTHIVVGVRDANGSLITNDNGRTITATFDTSSCTGAGGGTPVVSASTTTSGGLATFAIKSAGAYPACNITFSASGVTGVNALAAWTSGGVDHLACSFAPNPIVPDGASTSTGTVSAKDVNNNTVTSGSFSVNFTRTAGATTTLTTSNPQTTTAGNAYFTVKSQSGIVGTDTYTPSISSGTTLPATTCSVSVQ